MMQETGRLFVVAMPIGNMEDITLRALRTLASADVVAAEDTRVIRRHLAHHDIKGSLISYHDFNEAERTPQLIRRLIDGEAIALVSNAGTPSVSDPGYRLIKAAVDRKIPVIPVPGVSAVTAALSVSALPTDAFVFVGFLPKKKTQRMKELEALATDRRTIVFYESPKRIVSLLEELACIFGSRHGVLAREMTKPHEEFLRGSLSDMQALLEGRSTIKGEFTLLVSGAADPPAVSMEAVKEDLERLLASEANSFSDAVKTTSKKYGLPRKQIYRQALKLKSSEPERPQRHKATKKRPKV